MAGGNNGPAFLKKEPIAVESGNKDEITVSVDGGAVVENVTERGAVNNNNLKKVATTAKQSPESDQEENFKERLDEYCQYYCHYKVSPASETIDYPNNADRPPSGSHHRQSITGLPKAQTAFSSTFSSFNPPPADFCHTFSSGPPTVPTTDDNIRGSYYSQLLENTLFYSQAIRQIRESDCVDASNPYATAVPRVRPDKEGIRQRRARNAIASREVFNISAAAASVDTTPSVFIPLPSAPGSLRMESNSDSQQQLLPPRFPLPPSMRSEPVLSHTYQGNVPKQRRPVGDTGGFFNSDSHEGSGDMKTGIIDQPLPAFSAAETTDTPKTYASSIITTRSAQIRRRGHYNRDGGDDDSECEEDGEYAASRYRRKNRYSVSSKFSVVSSSTTAQSAATAPGAINSSYSHSPPPPVPPMPPGLVVASDDAVATQQPARNESSRGGHSRKKRSQVTDHSRKVATRLLMRAGFGSVAIRVARMGTPNSASNIQSQSSFDETTSRSFDTMTGTCESDEMQTMRMKRRNQVRQIDQYGFVEFEGDEGRQSEYVQKYEHWKHRHPGSRKRSGRGARPATSSGGGGLLRGDLKPGTEAKWETLLDTFDTPTLRGSRKVKRLIQAGVPNGMRAPVYYKLLGAGKLEKAGEYSRLVRCEPVSIYDVIERDVGRCYPDHEMFMEPEGMGQRQVRRVLRAYAQYNPAIGYCQGMGRLAGLFLIVGMGEEQAFWALATTIRNYIPRYYEPDLHGLRVHTTVFEVLLQERNPRLYAHLSEQGCDALMYATPWFMTVFTLSLPWATALRVWDWFAFRGPKVLFRVALAICDLASPYLLSGECPTITELLGFLLHIPKSLVSADDLIRAAINVKLSERHIEKLEAGAHATIVKKK